MLLNRFFNEPISTTEGLVTLAIVAASVLVGWLFERFAMPKLLDVTRDPAHDFDGLFVRSIRGVTIFWFVIGAFRFAVMGLPLAEHFSSDLDQILRVLLILTVTIALARFVSGSVKIWATRLEGAFPAISIFANLAQITVLLIGGLMALQTFDISVAPLLTALGVGGIAVALALSPTLENFISGLQIIMAKQLRAGDFIEMENGQRGYVDDITWRTTTIKSLGNSMIIL
ncbi:MAG: mechanosensitive ion channel, partial [Candidatus Poribacteria bacterium]|nr:mechanosensitive ion channel [Candidatus Poribacteria bacterium]